MEVIKKVEEKNSVWIAFWLMKMMMHVVVRNSLLFIVIWNFRTSKYKY